MWSSFILQKNSVLRFLLLFISLYTLLSLFSCLKDNRFGPSSSPNSESIISGLLIINGSPDAPAFDFVLNGEPIFPSNRAFTKYTPYFPLYAGIYHARFYTHNTYSNAFYTTDINLARGKYQSLFLAGTVANSLSTLLIEDDLTKPKAGNAKVRFLNLSPDVGGLDFSIVEDSLLASKKEFKQYTDFYEIPMGDYHAKIKTSTNAFIQQNYTFQLKLEEGKIYTVWAKGLVETTIEDQAFGNGLIIHDLNR